MNFCSPNSRYLVIVCHKSQSVTGAVQNTTITQKQSENVKQRLKHEIIIISTLIELKSNYCAQ